MRVAVAVCLAGMACGGGGSSDGPSDGGTTDAGTTATDDTDATTPTSPTTPTTPADLAIVPLPKSWIDRGDNWGIEGFALLDAARAFYQSHGDDYDYLLVYTEFPVTSVFTDRIVVGADIPGTAVGEARAHFGWNALGPADAGSAGELELVALMNAPSQYGVLVTADDVALHEVAHRFGAYLSVTGGDPGQLTGNDTADFNVFTSTGGPSALGYGDVSDLGGGSFAFDVHSPVVYSPFERYLMGLAPASAVTGMFTVVAPTNYDPPQWFDNPWSNDAVGVPVTYLGTRVDVPIGDVVAAYGPRAAEADPVLRVAFVLVCNDDCEPDALAFAAERQAAFSAAFSAATGGAATADTSL